MKKVTGLGLKFIADKLPSGYDINRCTVRFCFYVKESATGIDGKLRLLDKIYQCNLTYQVIGKDFELMDGLLIDTRKRTKRSIE